MAWHPGKQYELRDVINCSSITVTAAGEVVVWVKTQRDIYEARWYDQHGRKLHTLAPPPRCRHLSCLKLLAIMVGERPHMAISCNECQVIWLGSRDTCIWDIAWEANGEKGSEERKNEPKPGDMCQFKSGQVIARNVQGRQGEGTSISIFDIKEMSFYVVVPELKLGMQAWYLCCCEISCCHHLAVTDMLENSLCMFRLDEKALIKREAQSTEERTPLSPLWMVGGPSVKVAGEEWSPFGLCSDNRGRLYVADQNIHRIIVLSAASGSVLQVIQGQRHLNKQNRWVVDPGIKVCRAEIQYENDRDRGAVPKSDFIFASFKDHKLGEPWDLCWHEQTKSIICRYQTGIGPDVEHHICYLNFTKI